MNVVSRKEARVLAMLILCITALMATSSVGLTQSGPVIFVAPTSLDFGDAAAGTQFVAQPIVVRNDGTSDLIIYAMQLVGVDADEFRLVTAGFPFTLAATDTTAFGITFSPTSQGAKSAALRLVTNDPNAEILDVALTGNGAGLGNLGQVTASPIPSSATVVPMTQFVVAVNIDMTAANPSGSLLQAYQARLSWDPDVLIYSGFDPLIQTGGLPVAVGSAPAGTGEIEWYGSAILGGGLGGVVNAINFTFLVAGGVGTSSPLTLEILEAESDNVEDLLPILSVTNSAIQVVSNGTPADISVEPESFDYGTVSIGSSATQSILVSNDGIEDLTVSSTTFAGANADQFAIESGGAPFTLPAGQSNEMVVRFSPTSAGQKTVDVTINSNDPDEDPLPVGLSGTGTATLVPGIKVTPPDHDFGVMAVGGSASKVIVVTNEGAADLVVSSTTFVGDIPAQFSVASGGAPFTIPAGNSHNITVQFDPTDPGFGQTNLRIANNDPDENPVDVELSTFALFEGDIKVTPLGLNFGDVVLGRLVTQIVTVENEGTAPFQVVSAGLEGGPQNDFSFGQINLGYIQPGESATIEINFVPVSAATKNGVLKIFSEDADEKLVEVSLNGTGVAEADILVAPTAHDYGAVAIESSSSQSFAIRNVGTADLNVSTPVLTGTDADDFGVSAGGSVVTLAMGETQNVVVDFAPNSDGAQSAALRLANNDPDEDPTDIALNGSGFYVAPTIAPTLVSPNGNIASSTPEYEWMEIPRATEYRLVIFDPNANGGMGEVLLDATYDAATICSAGTCKTTPSAPVLSDGDYRWLAQGSNPAGTGPWSVNN